MQGFIVAILSALLVHPPTEPFRFVQDALRQHQIVFLGDIHPLAEPKLLVSRLIREQREDEPIDLLALEVASEQQEWIDRYLASKPEDVRILLNHPRSLRAHWGISAEYLEIYRSVHRWNRDHPGQQLQILAADVLGWPAAPLTPATATDRMASRDRLMAASVRQELRRHPEWRMLIFMGGYHGLKDVGGQVAMGRAQRRFERWFAGYLLDHGAEVYSILTDARQTAGGPAATRVFDYLARTSTGNFAVVLDSTTDIVREPMHGVRQEGFSLEFRPARFPLRRAVDAMIVLNRATRAHLIR